MGEIFEEISKVPIEKKEERIDDDTAKAFEVLEYVEEKYKTNARDTTCHALGIALKLAKELDPDGTKKLAEKVISDFIIESKKSARNIQEKLIIKN
jgi:uncharacterized protein YqgV (UPF0045/DUF77 family)